MLSDWIPATLEPAPFPTEGHCRGGHWLTPCWGVLELTPDQIKPQVPVTVISVAIHGNETAPVELLGDLLCQLDAEQLTLGAPTLLVFGHPKACVAQQRYLETNLNRLFQRGVDGTTQEHQRATVLMDAVDDFFDRYPSHPRLHLDLHTAIRRSEYPRFAVLPYAPSHSQISVSTDRVSTDSASTEHPSTDNSMPSATQWGWLSAAGIQAALLQHQHSWTFSHYSRHYHQATAWTLELGQVAPMGQNDLEPLAPMSALLSALIQGKAPTTDNPDAITYFAVRDELIRQGDQFSFHFADNTPNFTRFEPGTRLSEDNIVGPYIVDGEPVSIVFPNPQVEPGARAALLVTPTSRPDSA